MKENIIGRIFLILHDNKWRGSFLFKITGSALEVLEHAIKQEKENENEKLYVRLSMGIG